MPAKSLIVVYVTAGLFVALGNVRWVLGGENDGGSELFPAQAALINAAYGDQPWRPCDRQRAGYADCVRRHAALADNGHYAGYYVGGGKTIGGEGRYLDEGTFGWDYAGGLGRKRVALTWSHREATGESCRTTAWLAAPRTPRTAR